MLIGPRASCALMIMSAQDARGPSEHEGRARYAIFASAVGGNGPFATAAAACSS
jgi:hypothetical protein